MKTRVIHTKFWTDTYVRSLNESETFFFFYLMTNEYINVSHIYELPTDIASFQTKIPAATIEQIKNKFKADGKIDFKNEWIYLVNADKYSYFKGIKNNHNKLRLLIEMNEDVFMYFKTPIEESIKRIINETDVTNVKDMEFINLLNRVIHRGIDKGMGILPINQKSEIKIQKTETKKKIRFDGNTATVEEMN